MSETKNVKSTKLAKSNKINETENVDLIPFPVPFKLPLSGLYTWKSTPPLGLPTPLLLTREELRVDVDGRYPQMTVSGTIFSKLTNRVHWIANVKKTAKNQYEGAIWYKNGNTTAFLFTNIKVNITGLLPGLRKATVSYSGGGLATTTRTYSYASPYFHEVEFEYDCATSVTPVTSINTCDHPNRPASLPCETLNIEKVFQRAGFNTKKSGSDNIVPLAGAGANALWSDMEMHDAMQTFWSRFDNKAQWSMWTFFAATHEQGSSLGGIMFDSIGPNHRQGTAIFNNSFIANPPNGEANPAAWVARMKFWTACHEMGHSFNLAHSWQKQHPPQWGTPWIPLANEAEARSFMNYPYFVNGGQTAFFADFEYRFSDQELKFLRHAPAQFVQMGNADWFDNHGFRQALVSPEPTYRLEVRANRSKPLFEFLEPVVLELKLTNISGNPQIADKEILTKNEDMTIIIKKDGRQARQWGSFAQYCLEPSSVVLDNNESLYQSLFIAVGQNGWDVAEPGNYTIQVALHLENEEDIVSMPFRLRIAPPLNFDEEFLAQDFFSEDVGRVLSFDGTQTLESANSTLQEVSDKLSDRRVSLHANIALNNPLKKDYMVVDVNEKATLKNDEPIGEIKIKKSSPDQAQKGLTSTLFNNSNLAAETLGHIDYKYYADNLTDWLAKEGSVEDAITCQNQLSETLTKREVLKKVINDAERRKNSYVKAGVAKAR